MLISIVSPVYNAENIVSLLVQRIVSAVAPLTNEFEIVLVEDGSPDRSWDKIRENCLLDPHVKGIKLSRNFGQHHAIMAGLQHCVGEWIVVMDCDLQDRPEEIVRLYKKAQEGHKIVFAQRESRRDPFFKRSLSQLFYWILAYFTETAQDHRIANFGIYHSQVIEAVVAMKESFKFFPIMVKWVGFERVAIPVEHAERTIGKTNYNLKKLIGLGLSIALSYSEKPLRLTVKVGLWLSLIAFSVGLYNVYLYWQEKIIVLGYASLIVSVWFLGGLIIAVLGMVGLYVGRTFEDVKSRPNYIIDEQINVS